MHVWLWSKRDLVRKILKPESGSKRGVFRPEYVEMVLGEFETSRTRAFTIFMMLCVEFWFKHFVDVRIRDAHRTAGIVFAASPTGKTVPKE